MNLSYQLATAVQHHVGPIEQTHTSIDAAYAAAEQLTEFGFEVSKPKSMDYGQTYTFTARPTGSQE